MQWQWIRRKGWLTALALAWLTAIAGCAATPHGVRITDPNRMFPKDTIIHTETGESVDFQAMMADLFETRITYIGESHTDPIHHRAQLDIIKSLYEQDPRLAIGMEMFDRTYQPILDQWSRGELDENQFLEKSHWYANWKYDYALYRDLLEFARENHIRLIGLNIPFHIPAKIATGGIDNLSAEDRRHLPDAINTSNADHRAFVKQIHAFHSMRGRENFEYFYEAQCAWDEAMAEAVVETIGPDRLVVLAGRGHIQGGFGIPGRAFSRNALPYRTILLAPIGTATDRSAADYIWTTPAGRPGTDSDHRMPFFRTFPKGSPPNSTTY